MVIFYSTSEVEVHLTNIAIERFKKIERMLLLELANINVIVGGNGSGKSSILQAIHFSVMTAVAHKENGRQQTFSAEKLMYVPTNDFVVLRHGTPYRNQDTEDSYSRVTLSKRFVEDGADELYSYDVKIWKGKNHGNISCERTGDANRIGNAITNAINLFSIYAPGLAGISQREELKSKAIVRRGVASGDANLYLRNIIYYISQERQLEQLNELIGLIFPGYSIEVVFDEYKDTHINVFLRSNGRREYIELAGTGFLQALQIASYVIYFKPKLLLLDEPDSHLHPNNQSILCVALEYVADKYNTQVLLSTHSRHMVDALSDSANFIWVRGGDVVEQGHNPRVIPLLMDIGALDDYDRLHSGGVDHVILTEDSDKRFLRLLLEYNSFDMGKTLIYSYKTSSKIDSAMLFVDFLKEVAPGVQVIVHRDRDFMVDEEVSIVEQKIQQVGALPFVTDGSDIEDYFVGAIHISEHLGEPVDVVTSWLESLATQHHVEIQLDYTNKRNELNGIIYRGRLDDAPRTADLMGRQVPLARDKIKGKFLLKKVRGEMRHKFGREVNLLAPSLGLFSNKLYELSGADIFAGLF